MWKEYFDAHFHPEKYSRLEHWTNSFLYWLIALLFNGFPIPQTEAGAGESIRYMGELVEEGWSILIFPEGERSTTGEIRSILSRCRNDRLALASSRSADSIARIRSSASA